ncbi:MAG: TetR/AcrR family transcriptional regulator C-terminal domain-containing protein [Anaerolineae bacterium]|nr:TetR/AcrR family transcriptional regulator C-terminal domain-containing protein [Anaerolineae bacterium]
MNDATQDPRIVRTRALLRNALMALIADRGFSSLTIQDVTQQAGLHRTTFYLHYSGLHELLEDCAKTLFGEVRTEIYKVWDKQQDPASLEPVVANVLHHLERHEAFYRTLLGKHGDPLFRELFQALLNELIFEPITRDHPQLDIGYPLEMTLQFYSTGFIGIASWWLEKGLPISAEQAAQQVVKDILPAYLNLMWNGFR